jgi:hypothetical protein
VLLSDRDDQAQLAKSSLVKLVFVCTILPGGTILTKLQSDSDDGIYLLSRHSRRGSTLSKSVLLSIQSPHAQSGYTPCVIPDSDVLRDSSMLLY